MSLADRLQRMERRIAELEQFRDQVLASLADEEAAESVAIMTLDGESGGRERDQSQSLG